MATNLTLGTTSVKISKVVVKSSDTTATVHWLSVQLEMHEVVK